MSNERPLKSKYITRSREWTKSISKWGSKNRMFTSGKIKNQFQMKRFGEKIVLCWTIIRWKLQPWKWLYWQENETESLKYYAIKCCSSLYGKLTHTEKIKRRMPYLCRISNQIRHSCLHNFALCIPSHFSVDLSRKSA